MAYKININDTIPKFLTKDQDGKPFDDTFLIGAPTVLYFYPKDETPGCTKEACSFQDNLKDLEEFDVLLLGVSPDSPESHRKFIQNHQLNFTLLSDESLDLARKFDVLKKVDGKETKSIERTTFLIGPNGYIRWIERPVSVEGHTQRVLQAIKECII